MKHSVIRPCRAAATSFVLAAATFAAAADPATNAPILPAWFADVRIGMSTNEFFTRLPDAKWTCEDEGPTPWLVKLEGQDGPMALWSFSFPDGRLERLFAFSGEDRAVSAEERRALAAEVAVRLGRPVGTRRLEIEDLGGAERIGWTNETTLAALCSMTDTPGGPAPVFFVEMSREAARRDKDAQDLLRGLAPELVGPPPKFAPRDQAEAEAFGAEVERLFRPVADCLQTGVTERVRALALETDARLAEDDSPAAFWARCKLWQTVLDCDCLLGDESGFNAHLPVFEAFDESSPLVESFRALLADRLGRDDEIEPLLRAALAKARHPVETGSIETSLASFLSRSEDRLDEALVLARHAVSVLPEPAAAGAWRALGRALRLKGELPEAKEALEKAMSLSARLPAVPVGFRIDYALVLDAQGETNRVREILAELRPVPPVLDRQTARDLAGLEAKYPATNAPAEPPALLVRVASIEEIEKAIRGVADAVGMPALAEEPIRSLREGLAEMGVDVDPARPVVLALADPRASEEMAVAVPGPEPSAERLVAAFGGATPERGADGVWRQPGAEGNGTAMLRRDGYNVFAHPRERLAFADALLAAAAAPRFPGAALEATVRGEALRTIERELAWRPGVPGPSLAPLETVSFGAAFDASAGLFVPLAATPAESAAGAFAALAAAPALDPAASIWRDDALFAFAMSDLGTVFGGFAGSFFALTATNYAQNVDFALRRRGADPEEIARAERSAREAIERAEESLALLRSAGAASGFAALAPGGALESVAETAFRDSAAVDRLRARWREEADGRDVPVEMWVGSATNAFAFRQTDDGWEFGCRPWADGEEPSGPDATGPLAAMRRFFGPDGLRGEVRRVAGPGPGERLVSAVGPAGSPLPAPTGERPPDGAALERFVPGAKRVACVQAHLVDFARFALSPALGDAAAALPRGGRFRWDAGVRDGAPVGLFAFDPAELRAWVSLAMLGTTRAMTPAAPEPSGEEALFDD